MEFMLQKRHWCNQRIGQKHERWWKQRQQKLSQRENFGLGLVLPDVALELLPWKYFRKLMFTHNEGRYSIFLILTITKNIYSWHGGRWLLSPIRHPKYKVLRFKEWSQSNSAFSIEKGTRKAIFQKQNYNQGMKQDTN